MGYSPWGHKESDTTERLSTARDITKSISTGSDTYCVKVRKVFSSFGSVTLFLKWILQVYTKYLLWRINKITCEVGITLQMDLAYSTPFFHLNIYLYNYNSLTSDTDFEFQVDYKVNF